MRAKVQVIIEEKLKEPSHFGSEKTTLRSQSSLTNQDVIYEVWGPL
jgi:hypothetical protein